MNERARSWLMPGLVGVLAALLPVLAVLQYRWIGTLSDAEAARMRRSLHTSVVRFVEDVYHPLDRLRAAFLLGDPPADEPLAVVLARRTRRWRTVDLHADLLRAVYWIDAGPSPRLARLDADRGALRPQPWPAALTPWRTYLARLHADPSAQTARAPAAPPALLLPFSLPRPDTDGGYVLLTLDPAYAAQTLFPALAHTHFLDGASADYDVLIVDRVDTARVVFRAAPNLQASAFALPDAAADLGLLSRVQVTTRTAEDGTGAYVVVLQEDSIGTDQDVQVLSTETESVFLGSRRDDTERSPVERRLAAGAGTVMTTGPFTPWRLLVRHRAGSIEASVARWRMRNLGLSFGILLLLGSAAGLLYASSRRARRLAEQQMAFVAGVTHELRTPLAVIRSAAENLADGVVTDPAQARRYGQLIDTEGRRLSDLVEQALALAGARSNHAALDLRPLPIPALIDAVLARCRPLLDEAGATITVDVADDLPPVQADARALEGAVCNLVTNAVKYGGADRWVGLAARLVEDGSTRLVALTVRDRGPGVPADELPHVFEPFFRGRKARDAQVRGSGLGLSLVRHTAEAHGGRVAVESAVGEGGAFTIYLPVKRKT